MRVRGPFQRRIQIHEQVDAKAASATYESGLLQIVLPIVKRSTGSEVKTISSRPPAWIS